MPSTHRKEKPWDTDDIDHWKVSPRTHESVLKPRYISLAVHVLDYHAAELERPGQVLHKD